MTSAMTIEEKTIRQYLSTLGVRIDLAGYTYLVEVVEYLLANPTLQTKKAMESVGIKYHVSYRNVQNSIRYALKLAEGTPADTDAKQLIFDCVTYVRESEVLK